MICIWCRNIDPADHSNFMWLLVFFYNFEANLWKYYHATKDNSHLTFLAKMTQHGSNVVILTFQSCIDVAITTSVIYWKVNLLSIIEVTLLQHNKFDLVVSTLWRRHGFDVMISRLQQCCEYNRHSVSWVEPTFWQCQSSAVILTLWHQRRCNVVYCLCIYIVTHFLGNEKQKNFAKI